MNEESRLMAIHFKSGGYFEVFDDYWPEFRHSFIAKAFAHVHGEYYRTRSGARPFAHVCGPPRKQSIQLREWLDGVITRPGAAEQSVSKSPVDFSDARVRVYTEEDTDQNRTFLQLGTQIAGLNHLLKVNLLFHGRRVCANHILHRLSRKIRTFRTSQWSLR